MVVYPASASLLLLTRVVSGLGWSQPCWLAHTFQSALAVPFFAGGVSAKWKSVNGRTGIFFVLCLDYGVN
eukprot:scaffold84006_cov66-Cyclotella_meneghiniana.AAC.2